MLHDAVTGTESQNGFILIPQGTLSYTNFDRRKRKQVDTKGSSLEATLKQFLYLLEPMDTAYVRNDNRNKSNIAAIDESCCVNVPFLTTQHDGQLKEADCGFNV
uniref:Uncharacterized protein n=1 Tax=Glossina palpalis gambiensis TaxID=67801 RepID=A0A1B0BMY0_9MUSC